MNTREEDLSAALLWLRNHYHVGTGATDPFIKQEVLDRIDRVLGDGPPLTIAISEAFREKYRRIGDGTG